MLNKYIKKSLHNQKNLSLVRLSHRNGLKMTKIEKKTTDNLRKHKLMKQLKCVAVI